LIGKIFPVNPDRKRFERRFPPIECARVDAPITAIERGRKTASSPRGFGAAELVCRAKRNDPNRALVWSILLRSFEPVPLLP
jgi:hypothetical protein